MDAESLIHELHEHNLDPAVLRAQWHIDAPWQSSGALEVPTIQLGKLLYRQAMQREAQLYGLRLRRTLIDDFKVAWLTNKPHKRCLLYTSPSPRDGLLSRMPSSA